MLKKRYSLLIIKNTTHHSIPMVLYRKNGKFQMDYQARKKYCFNFLQAWYWYWLIRIHGRWGSQRLF